MLAGNRAAVHAMDRYLAQNLPFLKTSDIQNARQTVAILSLVGYLAITRQNVTALQPTTA